MAICGAQIATTVIVAPLGIIAIAANSFAITAESLCYKRPLRYSEAATTLVGQSLEQTGIRLAPLPLILLVRVGNADYGCHGNADIWRFLCKS